MRVAKGKVVSGRVVVEGELFKEGTIVTVIAQEEDIEGFELGPEEEQALLASIAEAERGETVEPARKSFAGSTAAIERQAASTGYPACRP